MRAFHPAVRAWFERRFPEGPTPAQTEGWPEIAAGRNTLIAAPTGSGKTLAGFLVCIDALYRAADRGDVVEGATQVVYVSPLKALAVDVQQNLETPLREIAEIAAEMGMTLPALRAEVRTGDTTQSMRAAMIKRPPNFLVTTPESLYLLVTAQRSRAALTTVTTIIVDEIHAVARDKRGSHLAVTLERLERLCAQRPVRIGLSATQRPIETVARLLVGAGPSRSNADGSPRCAIVDVGHRRALDVAIELPSGELEAVASREQLGEVLDAIAAHVRAHRTTLVFVNTRRMAERVAHSARRATRRRRGCGAPRQPLEGAPSACRVTAARRRVARARRDRVTGARHRHRSHRDGVSDRVAAQHRHVPAARRPLRATAAVAPPRAASIR